MSDKIAFGELIQQLSGHTDQSRNFNRTFIRELTEVIEEGLKSGEPVSLAGFGRFELRWRKERRGFNPQTGEQMTVPGRYRVIFKPYKTLRESVNQSEDQVFETAVTLEKDPGTDSRSSADRSGSGPTEPAATDEELIIERPSPVQPDKDPSELSVKGAADYTNRLPFQNRQKSSSSTDRTRRWYYSAAGTLLILTLLVTAWVQLDKGSWAGSFAAKESLDRVVQATDAQDHRNPQQQALAATYKHHLVETGETLWSLAADEFGDAYLWPWILFHNLDQIYNPNLIFTGDRLTIPEYFAGSGLKDWELKEVADGYLHVYHWYKERNSENARHFLWAAGSYNPDLLEKHVNRVDHADLRFARHR